MMDECLLTAVRSALRQLMCLPQQLPALSCAFQPVDAHTLYKVSFVTSQFSEVCLFNVYGGMRESQAICAHLKHKYKI
jgi:hypothetical protein